LLTLDDEKDVAESSPKVKDSLQRSSKAQQWTKKNTHRKDLQTKIAGNCFH
jgi:hypothetical protein